MTAIRRTHYEMAFESYLAAREIPFVSVEETRHVVPGGAGIKLFDYLVYPGDKTNYLVEVKGRKLALGRGAKGRRWECWVTRGDLSGLSEWEAIFGSRFSAAFVFAYWIIGAIAPRDSDLWRFAGRHYSFQVVRLADYSKHQRTRSPRWQTVTLTRDDFLRFATEPAVIWPRCTVRA